MAGFNDYMSNYFGRTSQGAVPAGQPVSAVPGAGFGYSDPTTQPAGSEVAPKAQAKFRGAASKAVAPLSGRGFVETNDGKYSYSLADQKRANLDTAIWRTKNPDDTAWVGSAPAGVTRTVTPTGTRLGYGAYGDWTMPGGALLTWENPYGAGTPLGNIEDMRRSGRYTPEQAISAVGTAGAARVDNTKADLLPSSTAADIANINSQVTNRNALTGEIHADAVSNRATQGAQRGLIGAQVDLTGAQTAEQRSATTSRDRGVFTDPATGDQYQRDNVTGRMFKLTGLGMLPK